MIKKQSIAADLHLYTVSSLSPFLLLTHSSQSAVLQIMLKHILCSTVLYSPPRPPLSHCLWLRGTRSSGLIKGTTELTHTKLSMCVTHRRARTQAPWRHMTYAHADTQHTLVHTPPWLWRPAMNHGCLYIHLSWLILLSDFIGVCRLQSRMFMVLSCHVFLLVESKKGLIMLKIVFSPLNPAWIKYSGQEIEAQCSFSCGEILTFFLHRLIVYWLGID